VPHIALPDGLPGITSGFAFRPATAKPLRELAEVLLRGPSTLTSGEREMIAAFVSARNDCEFCRDSHRAAAAHHLNGNYALVDAVRHDFQTADVSPKLRALLAIAAKVQQGGKYVTASDIEHARTTGATDQESTTLSCSPRPSACTTAMSTASPRGRHPIRSSMTRWGGGWLSRAMFAPTSNPYPPW
jgi:uncharacterized peroxidase-related enzyme